MADEILAARLNPENPEKERFTVSRNPIYHKATQHLLILSLTYYNQYS